MRELLGKKVNIVYEGTNNTTKIKGILVDLGDCFVGIKLIGVKKGAHTTYIPIKRIYSIKEVIPHETANK